MNELSKKSINTLELGSVLAMLSAEAVSEKAKETALALLPSLDLDDIRHSLRECTDAKRLMGLYGSPSFSGVRNISPSLSRVKIGGSLNMRELLEVASLLRASRLVKAYINDAADIKTSLHVLFSSLSPNRYLEDKITDAIMSEDEMADGASSELSTIRRHIKAANAKIRETLNRIISSPNNSKILQESIITLRSDRYVVPVRSECKGDLPGLIHDVSASGATLFIEPVQVVELNNEIRVLTAKEKKEIERILSELSSEVATFAEKIEEDYDTLCLLDFIFAKAKLSYKMNAAEPSVNDDGAVDLKRARHPLLNPKTVVAIDMHLGQEFDTLIITGPNTGGKTVSLKTLGLLILMAECGLHIPADESSRICIYRKIFADIGDEQSIEQSLSTFSSHMKNIINIIAEADSESLVLFDELGAGTDPTEGAGLAIAIIEHVRALGAAIAATTHYAELKAFALTTDGVENASCEFDVETLRPTYRLLIGVPGKSNAFAISKRLGLKEEIIEQAKTYIDSKNRTFDDVLSNLERERQNMERQRAAAEKLRRAALDTEIRSKEERLKLQKESDGILEKAKKDALNILEEARKSSEEVFEELKRLRREAMHGGENISEANAAIRGKLNLSERKIGAAENPAKDTKPQKPPRPLKAGDVVELMKVGTKATVLSPEDKDGNVRLQAGILKITAKIDELRLLQEKPVEFEAKSPIKIDREMKTASANVELDIRGYDVQEALLEVDRFLDSCLLSKLNMVSIIHGKGTGVLRSAVHAHLRQNRMVKSFRLGRYGEGESGVTIVEFR